MTDRASLDKEIADLRRAMAAMEKEAKQLRDWIVQNERALPGMQEALRRITEDGLVKARADLAQRENALQRMRANLAHNEKILSKLAEIERKQRDIATLEEEQERTIVLLERQRADLRQLQEEYEQLTRPVSASLPPCEVVLPNNQRIGLQPQHGNYLIGWHDGGAGEPPEIDLQVVQGSAQGVSRRHAVLRYDPAGWTITDLGSTNGTFLNDAPLAPNTPTLLADRTRIRLGNVMIFFRHITQTVRL